MHSTDWRSMSRTFDVSIEHDSLVIGPVRITFQRTLRLPEQGTHSLPPGLGAFPLRRVEDYPETAPADWLARGGVMLPIYQREAMWLSFRSDQQEPAALQVGIGKVCAVSGERWRDKLRRKPQNYVALPKQPWLDGINAGEGFVKQFVAVPLGLGATVEGQVTGEETHGGVQLRVVGLGEAALRDWQRARRPSARIGHAMPAPPFDASAMSMMPMASAAPDMGLGAGGRMKQEVYRDQRPMRDYDERTSARVFVHLCSATQWSTITGEKAPPLLIDRETYVKHGMPWYDYYDADAEDLEASEVLAGVKSVGEILGDDESPFTPVDPDTVIQLKDPHSTPVNDGDW